MKCISTSGHLFMVRAEEFTHKIMKEEKSMRMLQELATQKDLDTKDKIK